MRRSQKNWRLFKVFFTAGVFTFSGGMAMLPVIRKELVEDQSLISEFDLLEYSTISQGLPGVIALSTACFVGKKINGWQGVWWAGLAVILPAYSLMTIATIFYQFIPKEGAFLLAFQGIRGTACVFVFDAGWSLVKHNLVSELRRLTALGSLIATGLFGVNPVLIIVGLLVIGWFLKGKEVRLK
ncbi:chromate transporter [Vagococcus sp. BWB3-3]|uniref:Chromate transporter n=1 Tax=Vagococcus allomyrinae TaxID=2794353 RepID=A0A940PHU4_9ENTE|nr:chromate transporter [Vagococcus allomyrinae]MBP1043193.1 chromate transporter [Vagococcus allomyrinae]